MKTIRHVFLDGDPFEFCHACTYKTRWQCIQEKLNVLEPSKRLDMLRKNLTWVMKRALIVLCAQNNQEEADNIWRKSEVELWQYWLQKVQTLRDEHLKIERKPEDENVQEIEKLCQDVEGVTKQIQEQVSRCKHKDIYKKLKGYDSLLCCPRENQVLCDINEL